MGAMFRVLGETVLPALPTLSRTILLSPALIVERNLGYSLVYKGDRRCADSYLLVCALSNGLSRIVSHRCCEPGISIPLFRILHVNR